jgi:hypothetical protein
MSAFPQIGAGALAQFPIRRTRKWKSITNRLESAERIRLPDSGAGTIHWQFLLQQLNDAETAALQTLFTAARGPFGSFLFIDPLANLLGWSEDLSRPDWQPGLMTIAPGAADPEGTQRASSLTNPAAGVQALQQTLAVPGDYVACFSAWVRSSVPGTVTLARDGRSITSPLNSAWRRIFVTGTGAAGAAQSSFSIALAAGQSVDVWGLQVEAQPYAAVYKKNGAAQGIYEETYFSEDELKITHTSVGLSSCEIALTSQI